MTAEKEIIKDITERYKRNEINYFEDAIAEGFKAGREFEREELMRRSWCNNHKYSGETCLSCKIENQKTGRNQLADEIKNFEVIFTKDNKGNAKFRELLLKEKLQNEAKEGMQDYELEETTKIKKFLESLF